MAETSNAGGSEDKDLVGRLSQMCNRTSLMVIDATLRACAADDGAEAAMEVRALARRIARATHDFKATLELQPDPVG